MHPRSLLPLALLLLAAVPAATGVVSCGGGESPTKPDTAATSQVVTLTVAIGAGAIGTPSTSGPYARGTTVSYAYNTLPGYRDLRVAVDGAPVAAQGTITMNSAHRLVVTATATTAR